MILDQGNSHQKTVRYTVLHGRGVGSHICSTLYYYTIVKYINESRICSICDVLMRWFLWWDVFGNRVLFVMARFFVMGRFVLSALPFVLGSSEMNLPNSAMMTPMPMGRGMNIPPPPGVPSTQRGMTEGGVISVTKPEMTKQRGSSFRSKDKYY